MNNHNHLIIRTQQSLIRKINEEHGKQARTKLQIAGDISKYQTLIDPKDTSIPQPPPNINLGKRTSRGPPAKLPFTKERSDDLAKAKSNEEKVKESEDLKELKKRGRNKFEDDDDEEDEYNSAGEGGSSDSEDQQYEDEEDEEGSSYKERMG